MAGPGATLHARLLAQMRQTIRDGGWEPGLRLPKETDLAAQHGVSRMTMNKVLTQLAAEGYVIRRRRSGTVVAQPRAQSAVMAITDIAEEVAALGLGYGWRLGARALRPLTEEEAALFDSPAGMGPLLVVEGLHLARGRPFCRELRAINPDAVPEALGQSFDNVAPGQWLLQTMPWTGASHRVRAIAVGGAEARALDLEPGEPGLEILRQTRNGADWVTKVRLVYPGTAHQVVAEFTPSGAVSEAAG